MDVKEIKTNKRTRISEIKVEADEFKDSNYK